MRYESIDFLKGIAVLLMILFHFFYFPNQYGFKEFNYDTPFLNSSARIAQIIFITCVGINLYFSYDSSIKNEKDKNKYYEKQLYRVLRLLIAALFISVFSYLIFGDLFVKFGILHFIGFSSLLLIPFINNHNVLLSFIIAVIILRLLMADKSFFSWVPPEPAFIAGFYSKWGAVDHFPFIPWIIFICIGIIIGKFLIVKRVKESDKIKDFKKYSAVNAINTCGKYSFEIYIVHWVILYLFFVHVYPKFRQLR